MEETRRFWLVAAVLSNLIGCGPSSTEPVGDEARRYAEAVCGAIADCGCYDHFGSPAVCESDLEDRFSALVDAGLTIDLDCFEVVDAGNLDDCSAVEAAPSEWRCTVLQGDKQKGDACVDHFLELAPFSANECKKGLYCANGVCLDGDTSFPSLTAGASCSPEQATSCGNSALFCSPQGTCEPLVAEGGVCSSAFGCDLDVAPDGAGLYCAGYGEEAGGTCTRQGQLGQPCDPADWHPCATGAMCDPENKVCVDAGPGLCWLSDFPKAHP